MSRFFNQDSMQVEIYRDYNMIEIELPDPKDNYNIDYLYTMDAIFIDACQNLENTPTLFIIKSNFKELKKYKKMFEYHEYIEAIKNIFVANLIDKKKRKDRERRLGIPQHLLGITLSDINLMNIINFETLIPIFGIHLIDIKTNKIINKVF